MSIVGIDSSVLLSLFQARAGVPVTGAANFGPAPVKQPTAPWSREPTPAQTSALVKAAMGGQKFVDESAAKLDVSGASADYRKLFALYQGLNTLNGVATQASAKNLSSLDQARISKVFQKGLSEISAYVDSATFEKLRMAQGEVATSAKAKLGVIKAKTEYVTPPLTNSTSAETAAFVGDVQFSISIKRSGVTTNVPIDLAGMDPQPRTIGNVVNYVNLQLAATGLDTRFAIQRQPGQPRTIQTGGKTITLPPSSDQWALKVKVGTSETVSFSTPTTAPAVYVAQGVGDPDPDKKPLTNDGVVQQQLLKFQPDSPDVPPPLQIPGEANWVDGRVFAKTLGPEVKAVRATKIGPDGSVYMLADVTSTTAGQTIKGTQDVALLKYDSAGQLLYTRTLGAADTATGLGLAVSDDGKIAIAGSLTGGLNGAIDGALNSGPTGAFAANTDSFVTVYDTEGEELWTERRGAHLADEASQVAFAADGTVYVSGRSKQALPGSTGVGGWDSYIEGFKLDPTKPVLPPGADTTLPVKPNVKTTFTQTFGTTGDDRPAGMVVDGTNLLTATVENGHAVVRRFDMSGGTPVLAATRDLGDLMGGDIAGLALDGGEVVIAGSTANAALSAGTVMHAYAGGTDAFAARLSSTLAPGAGDVLAYYGGAGNDKATSMAVADGKVWIGGSAGTDLPNQAPVGTKDGFLASLDVAAGTVGWSTRFTGKDGQAAPSAIAVAATGASVLDRMGLPSGTLDLSDSQKLTAASALRAGDQFTIKVGEGRTAAVTIDNTDTLDTLAQKIRRASGFQSKVTLTTVDGVRSMRIEPLNSRVVLEVGMGKTNKDALESLGISEGVIRSTTVNADGKSVPADGKAMLYGLSLANDLNLSNTVQINHVLAELATAMGVVRTAYKDLVAGAQPKGVAQAAAKANGPVPAYLTNQIANYQAALNRLGGGG
ncbi:MAG: regulatory protein FlaEY [Phenylobacterium sp.]|nr:regulatory protein FlaEY [Phenylobacterium sp.]